MSRPEQPTEAYLVRHEVTSDDTLREIATHLSVKDLANLSSSCVRLFTLFQPDLYKVADRLLWQSVIDDDREQITKILKSYPSLLCTTAREVLTPSQIVEGIQSQLTWQIFDIKDETPLSFAIKRNQIEIVRVVVEVIEHVGDLLSAEQRQAIMTQWEAAEVSLTPGGAEQSVATVSAEPDARKKTPKERSAAFDFQLLINVIRQETFPNGVGGPFSEATEEALDTFRQTVLPQGPVSLDSYYGVEQLLMHAYKAYTGTFYRFHNSSQQDLFCVKVIGYIQGLLSREVVQAICEGLYSVVEEGTQISSRARQLQLRSGENFYRPIRDVSKALGFDFYVGFDGLQKQSWGVWEDWKWDTPRRLVDKLCQAKTAKLGGLKDRLQNCLRPHDVQQPEKHTPSSCLIL